jgi:hypothetical protein
MRSAYQKPQTRSLPKAPSLAADLAELGRALRSLIDPYRPELYYMRGPGPKWHAKHDRAPAIVDASAVPALVPGMADAQTSAIEFPMPANVAANVVSSEAPSSGMGRGNAGAGQTSFGASNESRHRRISQPMSARLRNMSFRSCWFSV